MKRNIARNTFKVIKKGFQFNSKFYATAAFGAGAVCEMYTYKVNGGTYGSGIGFGFLLAALML